MSEMIGNEVKKNFCAPARRFGIFSPFGFRARLFSFLPRPSGGSKKKKEVFFYVSQCSFGSQRENHQYRQMGFRRRHRRPLRSHRRHLYQGEKTVRRQTHRFRRHLPQSVLRSVLNQSFPVTYGGSITLASFVPLLIYTYVYGLADGLLTGLIFGLFNFVTGPYILTPLTFILDYLLAFASIGLMGIAGKFTKKTTLTSSSAPSPSTSSVSFSTFSRV